MGSLDLRPSALILTTVTLAACAVASAQAPAYGVGRTPTAEEVRAWDITISNDGKGLPEGHGTAAEGEKLYRQKCAGCHGVTGRGGQAPPVIIDKDPNTKSPRPRRVLATRLPFAPTLWDYLNRAMPLVTGAGTLKPDEVYALTAFLLYKNEIINESDVLDAKTLPKVKMPNREGFVPPVAWKKP
jgi:cytochrome c